MANGHHELSPSRCNKLWQCPCFKSAPGDSAAAERGTQMHLAVQSLHESIDVKVDLSKDDWSRAAWGNDWLQRNMWHLPMHYCEYELDYQCPDDPFDSHLNPETAGTIDYIFFSDTELHVIDIKTGQMRDYWPQMKIYALMAMQHYERTTCHAHILYLDQLSHVHQEFGLRECERFWSDIKARVQDGTPNPCEYCSWCDRQADCPALTARVTAVARAQSWELTDYDPASLTNPVELGKAYDLACQIEKWCDAVKARVAQAAREGTQVDGYRLVHRSGSARVTDIRAAYESANIPAAAFLACCTCSVPKLRDAFADANAGMMDVETGKKATKKALAGKIFDRVLGAHIETGGGTTFLQRVKRQPQGEILDDCAEDGEI